ATVQATPSLAEVALPVTAGSVSAGVPTPCAPPATTTTTTVAVSGSTTSTTSPPVVVSDPGAPVTPTASELPRTGSSTAPLVVLLVAVGAAFVRGTRGRRT